ncbi:ubiquitin-like domain-containing protein [Legionella sp. CNM-4043-24]|uniref:ubiquitin-like domain-containing protein n=1 Tax=Legionella sp. CNM-4043-24 TaxID=3421646 RepID=UPI00403B0AC6
MMPTLYIKALTGETHIIENEVSDTVLEIKQKIFSQSGIPADEQRLMLPGGELKDTSNLHECFTKSKANHILLVRKLPDYSPVAQSEVSVASSSSPVAPEYSLQSARASIVDGISDSGIRGDVDQALSHLFHKTRSTPDLFNPFVCEIIAQHTRPLRLVMAFLKFQPNGNDTALIKHIASLGDPFTYVPATPAPQESPVSYASSSTPILPQESQPQIKVLAFDVPETLQGSAPHDEGISDAIEQNKNTRQAAPIAPISNSSYVVGFFPPAPAPVAPPEQPLSFSKYEDLPSEFRAWLSEKAHQVSETIGDRVSPFEYWEQCSIWADMNKDELIQSYHEQASQSAQLR